ncbi:hypothetical protein K7W03_07855 [Sphingobium sp. PNB]|uniref:hypothetical protein n=1 Tax=Sphingobium sp. PNB TaxID=863934 RepID=UPI001CA3A5E4|nr:hypothetical protein [Sphingobium sp. PNB]MCB4859514.1 hypothetical protein [Sphingobium sp. PNB]
MATGAGPPPVFLDQIAAEECRSLPRRRSRDVAADVMIGRSQHGAKGLHGAGGRFAFQIDIRLENIAQRLFPRFLDLEQPVFHGAPRSA